MRADLGSAGEAGILMPSLPQDLAARSQRQRILGAMASSCAKKTFARTTIADLVAEASISRATFYKHFSNKEECFHSAAEEFVAELRGAAVEARGRADGSSRGAVRCVIAAVLEKLARKPDQAKLLLVEAPNVDAEIVRRYRALVLSALEAEMAGEPGDGQADPEIAFGRAKLLIAEYIAAGKTKSLPSLTPELVYVALLPHVGQRAALEQAEVEDG